MRLVELHPEELIDRAREGALATAERHDLGSHLGRCPACVAEQQWGADVAAILREEAGSDRARADRLVAAVMDGRRTPVGAPDAGRPRSRRAAMVMVLVASACLLSGAAAATLWPAARRLWSGAAEGPAAPGGARGPGPARAEPQAPAPAPSPPPTTTPPAEATPDIAPARIAAPAPRRAPATEPETAATVFAELARARQAGRLIEARRAHDLLIARYPGTREERTGRLLVAQLALRSDQPAVARQLYEHYLGTDGEGPLAEEARLGRALALERLGRQVDEGRAWRELLDRHPRSIHAARARSRLAALGANPR